MFLDLSNVFDTIDHKILLRKRFKDKDSCFTDINIGVPQGSYLGPPLVFVCRNDVHKSSNILKFILFADETNVYINKVDVAKAVATISVEFNSVYTWLGANKFSLT